MSSVPEIIALARTKLSNGDGTAALQMVMEVIRLTKGEAAVFETMNEMKRQIQAKEDMAAGMDVLCAQMEEDLLIDDQTCLAEAERICRILESQQTILLENGNEDILRDAFEDGSSLVCANCGDLVARSRWRQHRDKWCSAVASNAMDGSSEEEDC